MATSTLSPVQFHESTLYIINHNGEPFPPMRPIVEGMGLDWSSQHAKIKANSERWATVAIIATVQDGKERETLCMPVRKLPAFMASINPKKVREELRERIRLYQDECDNALWDYWTKGQATKPAKRGRKAIGDQQKALPSAPRFDEAPYLAFVEECRQAHTQAWELEHIVSRKATQLFAPLVVEIQQRASLQNRTWSQFVPDQQWFHAIYLACKDVMTYPNAQLGDDYNPGMLLLGYVRALNAR